MKLEIKSDWLLRKVGEGGEGIVSVGGLANQVENAESFVAFPSAERAALAQLVEWQRRKLRLTVEQLASQADIEMEDVLAIEKGEGTNEPRTVYKLGQTLKLPADKLMSLAGLVTQRDPRLEKAAVRFAASSAPVQTLSTDETKALEEFVKILAE